MATTEFAAGSAFAVQRWSAELAHESIGKTWFKMLLGDGDTACVMHKKDLESQAGDTIRFDVRYQDRSPGVQGDAKLEDFESPLEFYQDTLLVDQLRQAHAFKGMTQQRTVHDLRREGRDSLSDWFARVYDAMLFSYLAGRTGDGSENIANILGTGGFAGNPLVAPDADHTMNAGGAAGGSEVPFTIGDIDALKARALTLNPAIRPFRVDGQDKWLLVIHPWTEFQMKRDAGASGWNLIQQRAGASGSNNRIFTGACGEYNNVVIHVSEYLPTLTGTTAGDGTGTIDNLFLGAGAAAFGQGNAWPKDEQVGKGSYFTYHESKRDYGNIRGIAGGSCFGMKATIFNGTRYGMIRCVSSDHSESLP